MGVELENRVDIQDNQQSVLELVYPLRHCGPSGIHMNRIGLEGFRIEFQYLTDLIHQESVSLTMMLQSHGHPPVVSGLIRNTQPSPQRYSRHNSPAEIEQACDF